MSVIILCSDDIWAGILCYPLLQQHGEKVAAILIQSDILTPGKSAPELLRQVAGQSGWRYSLYLALELTAYNGLEKARRRLGLNRSPSRFLARPSVLARQFQIRTRWIRSVHRADILQQIAALKPDLIITLRFSEIIKPALLCLPSRGILNFHPSLLPRYAGLGSTLQAMSRGEGTIGCTVHLMNDTIDSGPIIAQETVEVKPNDSLSRICLRTYIQGARLIPQAVNRILKNQVSPVPYSPEQGSYYSWPSKTDVSRLARRGRALIKPADLAWLLLRYSNEPEHV